MIPEIYILYCSFCYDKTLHFKTFKSAGIGLFTWDFTTGPGRVHKGLPSLQETQKAKTSEGHFTDTELTTLPIASISSMKIIQG